MQNTQGISIQEELVVTRKRAGLPVMQVHIEKLCCDVKQRKHGFLSKKKAQKHIGVQMIQDLEPDIVRRLFSVENTEQQGGEHGGKHQNKFAQHSSHDQALNSTFRQHRIGTRFGFL